MGVAVVWGVSFVVVKDATITMPTTEVVGWRFGIAAIVLIHQFGAPAWTVRLRPVFWLEVAACVAFAVSWLVKGQSLGPVAGAETAAD